MLKHTSKVNEARAESIPKVEISTSGTESVGGAGQTVYSTGSGDVLEYGEHQVLRGVPYDLNRKVSVAAAEGNEVIRHLTVQEATGYVRTAEAKQQLKGFRNLVDRFTDELLDCLGRAARKGDVVRLDSSTVYERHFKWKKQQGIEGEVINLVQKLGGLEGLDINQEAVVNEVRAIARRSIKSRMSGNLWSGTFYKRNNASIAKSSGLMCVDFDKLNESVDEFMARLHDDPLIFWATRSPSGSGVKVLVRIPDDAATSEKKYLACFKTFERYVEQHYPGVSLSVDEQAKAISQLCFFTYDDHSLDVMTDAYVLLPDDDLLVAYQADASAKKKKKKAEAKEPDQKQEPGPKRSAASDQSGGEAEGPMAGWSVEKQWETIQDAVESLVPHADALREGGGERNALWTRLGYAIGSWAKGVEDGAIVDEARECVKEWEEAHYSGSGGCVLRAFENPNGSVSLGTLFSLARAHGDWIAPWKRERIKVNKPDGMGGQKETEEERAARLDGILDATEFDFSRQPPPLREIYKLAGKVICTPGNLTTITASIKTGKSAVVGAMIAAAVAGEDELELDLLGFSSSNPHGRAVIHLDTEQAPDDFWWLVAKALKRGGVLSPPKPDWLHSYCLTGRDCYATRAAMERAVKRHAEQHGGVHSVFIDGVADLVADVNDPAECNAFVAHLHGMAIQYDCPIVCVIHFNPGTEKSRGHLGSQLERKAETNLRLDKDKNEVTTVWSIKQRRAPILRNEGASLMFDDEAGMHVSCPTPPANLGGCRSDNPDVLLLQPLLNIGPLKLAAWHGQLRLLGVKLQKSGLRKRAVTMKGKGLVQQDKDGCWSACPNRLGHVRGNGTH